jgi:type II secretory pathway pseudopilin PulG
MSPGLPRHTGSGDLNLDEDMARILGDADESSASLLRRVSNAVRHGRSFSDMEMRSRASAKWSRSPPLNGSIGSPPTREISSPTTGSSEAREENAILKHELRRSAQRIVELEARVSGNSDMKSLDTKLREKRSTMAFLDTQKELIVRELEVLTEHVADSKRTQQPLNLDVLRSKVVRDFAAALQRLKDSYGPEIEELVQRKNQLVEETANLSRLRDQAIQEMEQLNLKNAQLADLNNELTHQIQERYRANREVGALDSPRYQINGLGIYGNHLKERFDSLTDQRDPRPGQAVMPSNASGSTEVNEGEQPGVVTAPHVVNIRKGQVKKFNWKKNVSKGLKTAFSSSNQSQQQQQHQQQQLHQQQQQQQQQQQVREGHAYDTMPYGMAPVSEVAPPLVARSTSDTSRHGLGLFGSKQNRPAPPRMQSSGTLTVPTVEAPKSKFCKRTASATLPALFVT